MLFFDPKVIGVIIPLFLNINVGGNVQSTLTNVDVVFADMNGDGFPDFCTSSNSDNLSVRLSQIGTTNYLRRVSLPRKNHESFILYLSSLKPQVISNAENWRPLFFRFFGFKRNAEEKWKKVVLPLILFFYYYYYATFETELSLGVKIVQARLRQFPTFEITSWV